MFCKYNNYDTNTSLTDDKWPIMSFKFIDSIYIVTSQHDII
jgi:hypothetical protein